ncbi:uncharacterized protein TM35_000182640 [Trypanosoma theileri]|uniref:Uncharacterized protein n=1 Tax=Trypanosoma theileri TaxID=67003 RepID=A0A1X0NU10_9TRYP|nr:uncharacterized protein TM35_000182640 [Trypanosoma theileri]ORC88207.1 hypothetical protein TM35_000182640 [Trypanosoma theileri]
MSMAPGANASLSPTSTDEGSNKDYVKMLRGLPDGLAHATTATQARFVNEYDPLYDKPYTRYELNTGRYLDEELCRVLEDDRRSQTKHHLQTNKTDKAYMLALIAHSSIVRSKD